MASILLAFGTLLLFHALTIDGSRHRSDTQSNMVVQDICERLHDIDIYSDKNRKWHKLCAEWIETQDHQSYEVAQDTDIVHGQSLKHRIQPRKARASRIRSRRSGSRRSSSSSSSFTRYRNTRTGTTINRPNGWLWSRSSLIFLPFSTRFAHRSRSSSSRYTTTSTNANTYYYCTATDNPLIEIQCSTVDGDTQCCESEGETSQEPFCCGGDIPDYLLQDMNRATQMIARVFYTLATLALCMHILIRRFH